MTPQLCIIMTPAMSCIFALFFYNLLRACFVQRFLFIIFIETLKCHWFIGLGLSYFILSYFSACTDDFVKKIWQYLEAFNIDQPETRCHKPICNIFSYCRHPPMLAVNVYQLDTKKRGWPSRITFSIWILGINVLIWLLYSIIFHITRVCLFFRNKLSISPWSKSPSRRHIKVSQYLLIIGIWPMTNMRFSDSQENPK